VKGARLSLAVAVIVASLGCGKKKEEPPPAEGMGQAMTEIAADNALLHDATGAANEVIRNAADCPAARASIDKANEKLNAIEPQLKTVTGRTTLSALRTQVERISQLCP
jgi:hypothetical protein